MTTDVVSVSPEMTLRDTMALFAYRHLSGAPVVASGKVVGVISTTDLMELAASLPSGPIAPRVREDEEWDPLLEGMDGENEAPQAFFSHNWERGSDVAECISEVTNPGWNTLEEHTVAEAMTRTIFSLPPGTAVEFAALRMRDAGVHRVLVMQGPELVGIVSTKDIVDAVAARTLTARRFVFSSTGHVN